MKIDCVFSGGGVKAYSFLGALDGLDEKGYQIERVAGTSAGAIFASLIAANYTTEEIKQLTTELQLKKLLDPPVLSRFPIIKWLLFYYQKGLYKGDKFEKWLETILAKKGIYTFQDIKDEYLKIIVSDISLGKLIVIPDDLQRVYNIDPNTFSVATAVRMSSSFPYFFMPKIINAKTTLQKSYIVDGGILSNFPLWIFNKEEKEYRPVLGMTLSDNIENATSFPIKNALDMLHALFSTMQRAHDSRYIAKSKEGNIIFIPVKDIKTTDMKITDTQRSELIQLGRMKTNKFLKTWPT